MKKRTKLTLQEFHNWKSAIFEMQKEELNKKLAVAELRAMQKDTEILNLKSQLFAKQKVESVEHSLNSLKEEYHKIKSEIEKSLGYCLNNMVIDELTLDIKDNKQIPSGGV